MCKFTIAIVNVYYFNVCAAWTSLKTKQLEDQIISNIVKKWQHPS